MKSINSHLSIFISSFILLFSFQFTNVIKAIVDDYASKIITDYSIVIVASTEMKDEDIRKKIPEVSALEEISSKKILDRLKNDMSSKNLSLLQVALPKFYSLKLESLPNKKSIEAIKQKLLSINTITRVETFSKTHEKMFKMFLLLQTLVYGFAAFVGCIALLLILKQIRIWIYEHQRRMAIMSLFGASFFMKSAMLYRMALVDMSASALCVCIIYTIAPRIPIVQAYTAELDIALPAFNILYEGGILIGSSILVAIITVTLAARKIGRA